MTIQYFYIRKQVSQAGISNGIPQDTEGCNYLSLPEIPASGTEALIYTLQYFGKYLIETNCLLAVSAYLCYQTHYAPTQPMQQASGNFDSWIYFISTVLSVWPCWRNGSNYQSNLSYKPQQIPDLKYFSSPLAAVFDQFIEARCKVENEDVVGAAPTGAILHPKISSNKRFA